MARGATQLVSSISPTRKVRANGRPFSEVFAPRWYQGTPGFLPIVECALWKVKLSEIAVNLKDRTIEYVDRYFCRVSGGAEGVISNVLSFLERLH